jgi:hypothetical protein
MLTVKISVNEEGTVYSNTELVSCQLKNGTLYVMLLSIPYKYSRVTGSTRDTKLQKN